MLDLIATQWTTPKTNVQRPFILWLDWTDVIPWLDVRSVKITDSGGNVPAQLTFRLVDGHGTLGNYVQQQMRVLYFETGPNRVLFHGFVKRVTPTLVAQRADYLVECVDLSEMLDVGLPIETAVRPVESDQARIDWALTYCTWSSMPCGGFVQVLNASMSAGDFGHATTRSALEDTLQRSGAAPVGYYVDGLGYLHTYAAADAGAAPYNISDNPNYTTTIPALVEPEFDGQPDADYAFVYGGTQAGTGVVGLPSWAPRFPARYRVVDANDSIDAPTLANVGTTELTNGRNVLVVKITVSPDEAHGTFDGWAKGQSILVTNAVLGWVAKSLIICGVDVSVLDGKGRRRYVLTCGPVPVQRMRLIHNINHHVKKLHHKRIHHRRVRGHRGPAKSVGH